MGKGEIARNEQFLLFPQCFLINQIIVSPLIHIFDITSLFAAELEDPKICIWCKGLNNLKETFWQDANCLNLAIFDITSLFAAELEDPKICIWCKGLNNLKETFWQDANCLNLAILTWLFWGKNISWQNNCDSKIEVCFSRVQHFLLFLQCFQNPSLRVV